MRRVLFFGFIFAFLIPYIRHGGISEWPLYFSLSVAILALVYPLSLSPLASHEEDYHGKQPRLPEWREDDGGRGTGVSPHRGDVG